MAEADTVRTVHGGLFITFEGPECSGKSTQAQLLARYLRDAGYRVHVTREPGGTEVAEELRRLVKQVKQTEPLCIEAELFIFCAARAQHMREVIMPHLEQGGVVLCDRFADSTTAYQGYGRGLDLAFIEVLHQVATCGRWPDLTFLLDMSIDEQFRRGQLRLETLGVADRFDDESRAFHGKVRQGYQAIAAAEPQRVKVIDGAADRAAIEQQIRELTHRALG